MNNTVIARNLLIVHQAEELASLCAAASLPIVLLKGSALIMLSGDYLPERMMEDIDLLVRPSDLVALRSVLRSAGYTPSTEDPWAFRRPDAPAHIDLIDALWYLDRKENTAVFDAALHYPIPGLSGAFHLPPDEFYRHVLAHAAVHHAAQEPKWHKDLQVLEELFGKTLDRRSLEEKLRSAGLAEAVEIYLGEKEISGSMKQRFYRWLLLKDVPLKGHVTRFLFLPPRKKPAYLWSVLFPPAHFVSARYTVRCKGPVWLYRLCRPLLLGVKLLTFFCTTARRITERPPQ